jgi:hypothetical protein
MPQILMPSARVAELLASHHIPAAERLLAGLLSDARVLAAATPEQRCRIRLEWGMDTRRDRAIRDGPGSARQRRRSRWAIVAA